MPIQRVSVLDKETNLSLRKWFNIHYNCVSVTQLHKKCRKGEVRLNGRRAKLTDILEAGTVVRVPPLYFTESRQFLTKNLVYNRKDARFMSNLVIYENKYIFALNKPPGLAVQGGSKIRRHVEALSWYLLPKKNFKDAHAQKPHLVHRLDKGTSGVLLLAKTPNVAIDLMHGFKESKIVKIYWAIVVGRPQKTRGVIDAPLRKSQQGGIEKIIVDAKGKQAMTEFKVLHTFGKSLTLIAIYPRTGRTHQIRVHMAHIDLPILGDGKYGGKKACFYGGAQMREMYLHARYLRIPGTLWKTSQPTQSHTHVTAQPSQHMGALLTASKFGQEMTFLDKLSKDMIL